MYTQVKYEYAPRKFAFGQLDGDADGVRGSVKVKWITRRRHLPATIDSAKLRYGNVVMVNEPVRRPEPIATAVFGANDGR